MRQVQQHLGFTRCFKPGAIWPGLCSMLPLTSHAPAIQFHSNLLAVRTPNRGEREPVAQKLIILTNKIWHGFSFSVAKQSHNHTIRVGSALLQNSEMPSKQRRPPKTLGLNVRAPKARTLTPTPISPSATLDHLVAVSPCRSENNSAESWRVHSLRAFPFTKEPGAGFLDLKRNSETRVEFLRLQTCE